MDSCQEIIDSIDVLIKKEIPQQKEHIHIDQIIEKLVKKNSTEKFIFNVLHHLIKQKGVILLINFLDKLSYLATHDSFFFEKYAVFLVDTAQFFKKNTSILSLDEHHKIEQKIISQLTSLCEHGDFIKIITIDLLLNTKLSSQSVEPAKKTIQRYYFHVFNTLSKNISHRYHGDIINKYLIKNTIKSLKSQFLLDNVLEKIFYQNLTDGDSKYYLLLERLSIGIKQENININKRYEFIINSLFNKVIDIKKVKKTQTLLRQSLILTPGVSINLLDKIDKHKNTSYRLTSLIKKIKKLDLFEKRKYIIKIIDQTFEAKKGRNPKLKISLKNITHKDIFKRHYAKKFFNQLSL